jgi:hypothetical protein
LGEGLTIRNVTQVLRIGRILWNDLTNGKENLIRNHLEDLVADGNIEWLLGKMGEKVRTDSSGSGHGPIAGFCEHGNEL